MRVRKPVRQLTTVVQRVNHSVQGMPNASSSVALGARRCTMASWQPAKVHALDASPQMTAKAPVSSLCPRRTVACTALCGITQPRRFATTRAWSTATPQNATTSSAQSTHWGHLSVTLFASMRGRNQQGRTAGAPSTVQWSATTAKTRARTESAIVPVSRHSTKNVKSLPPCGAIDHANVLCL